MFFYRPRSAEPVELAGIFTPEESARISGLRVRFLNHPDHFKLGMDYRHLEFARWLVDHGRISEWSEKSADLSSERQHPYRLWRGQK